MKAVPPGAARSSTVEKTTVDEIMNDSRFMRVADVARERRLSKSFVRTMVAEGLLPARRLALPGRSNARAPLLIARADVERAFEKFDLVRPVAVVK
jgi:hypothetical protein